MDRQIIILQRTIDAFKKYDAERTVYISKLQTEIGQLKAYIEELEETKNGEKLKSYKATITDLNKKLAVSKFLEADGLDLDIDLVYENICLTQQNKSLKEKNKKLEHKIKIAREANTELILQLNRINKSEDHRN